MAEETLLSFSSARRAAVVVMRRADVELLVGCRAARDTAADHPDRGRVLASILKVN
jgi:hypothetical protein